MNVANYSWGHKRRDYWTRRPCRPRLLAKQRLERHREQQGNLSEDLLATRFLRMTGDHVREVGDDILHINYEAEGRQACLQEASAGEGTANLSGKRPWRDKPE